MEFKTAFYGLNKKIKKSRKNGLIFNQINKQTIKIHSNLSNIDTHYYLKHQISIMHRQFFKKISQKPENVQIHCNDLNNSSHFACRKWFNLIN